MHENMDFAANTCIISHGGRTLATVEACPLPTRCPTSLDTIGPCDFAGTLPGGFAAHTKLDHATGELHAIAYYWAWDHVQHVVVDAAGKVTRTTDIAVTDGPMMHDFALTARYVVLMDLPVTFSLNAVTAGKELPYVWNPAHQARVGLLPRDGSPPARWIEIEPCWVFHCLNAYDDNGKIVVDLCRVQPVLRRLHPLGRPRTSDPGPGGPSTRRPARSPSSAWTTAGRSSPGSTTGSSPARTATATAPSSARSPGPSLPTGDFRDDAFTNAILRHDLTRGTVEAHEFGRDATAGEAVFAPSSPDAAEDDGYVMTFVHNPDRGAADLVILAAQDFTADPIARVHLPARIPLGFHGSWIPDPA